MMPHDATTLEPPIVPAATEAVSEYPSVLAVEALGASFGDHEVLADVSFEARGAEFVALLGRSGAGKTTLLRIIAGLMQPSRGRVRLDGENLPALSAHRRRHIAVVFQQFNLVRRLTAIENVLAGRLGYVPAWRGMLRAFPREDRLIAFECLERVGLLHAARQRADTLSGGEQQRVAIARALAQRPQVMLADEPVASVDPETAGVILELLRAIAAERRVVVVCSLHQVALARTYADRIVGLASGRIVVDVKARDFSVDIASALYRA
jgi:phosphonate transport system ATP-binding protein